ncbi:malto-oligosyltrehalose trehalohydrolase [Desertivirga arenae]|uniref:malto-oligosyltrehalose trehalohydrolase n=1 Tax=Desertivirga arenae TaxID=2810309 RepID=UPI001A966A2B|nr:malto-oligosyltrehalose trehalohydrolase [Pedobacter sp. SYSU D00823]
MKHKTLGVSFNEEEQAEVLLWAPKAEKVEILLKENGKKLALQEEEGGYWSLTTSEIKAGDRYMFVLDDEKDRPDPASRAQEDTVHGSSLAVNLKTYQWTDQDWQNLDLEKYIIYELHTGTFSPEGTFEGIEKKLDYLLELGVNAIEIMPVAQFPGGRNWGYDGVLPFAAQNTYGGAAGLQHLVDACHQKGISVILDCVYNHMGPEGNYLGDFGHYFTDKYNTPWGNAINFDDEWCDGVRRYFIENVMMWFRDFHIDALRLDAVHAIKDFSPVHILREIKQNVDQLMQETGRRHYLIVELDLNDTRYINPLEKEGYGMDAQWVDEFHHALRVTAGGDRNGYYSDFIDVDHLAKAYKDAYVYDGQFSPHRKKMFGIKAENNPGKQFIVFSQNHDQVGNRMLGERTSQLHSFEMQKLLAGAVLISPYIPMLFMGEEYGESNPFLYFVSHTDQELAELVRKGRKAEFAAFHAEGEAPDPVSESTFQESKLQWHLPQQQPHSILFNYYKTLIQLRKDHPVLSKLDRTQLEVEHQKDEQVVILHRWDQGTDLVFLLNFANTPKKIRLPGYSAQWHKLLNSASSEFGGSEEIPDYAAEGENILIPAEAMVIYQNSAPEAS